MKRYTSANLEVVKKQKHDWYIKTGGRDLAKIQREQAHYDGKREAVLMRDGYKCVKCGSLTQLVVHHKDGNGRGCKNPNNAMDNLETQCLSCHVNQHRNDLVAARNSKQAGWWYYAGRLTGCQACGTSARKHAAQGYCATCYKRALKAGITSRKWTRKITI